MSWVAPVRKESNSEGDRIPEAYKMSDQRALLQSSHSLYGSVGSNKVFCVGYSFLFLSVTGVPLFPPICNLVYGTVTIFHFLGFGTRCFLGWGSSVPQTCNLLLSIRDPWLLAAAFTCWARLSDTGCQWSLTFHLSHHSPVCVGLLSMVSRSFSVPWNELRINPNHHQLNLPITCLLKDLRITPGPYSYNYQTQRVSEVFDWLLGKRPEGGEGKSYQHFKSCLGSDIE